MSLIKTVATVGGWTLVYRISSFVRDIMQAHILGAGLFADAFSVAFKFANILRKLFAEGSFNASFLPIFAGALKERGHKEAEKIASQTLTWLVFGLSFFSIICLIFFRGIIGCYASGMDQASEKFAHTVTIGRICFPYVAASFLAALFGGILNTVNKFAMPAAAQLMLNISVVAALFIGALWFPSVAYTMAWGTFFGGVLQAGILWINVKHCKFNIGFDFSPMTADVKAFFKKMVSGAVGAGVWQLNVIFDFIIVSYLPTGAISYLYYTDHVNQLPIGILGIAFSTALLPPLTRAIHAKNNEVAEKQMNYGLLFAFIFTLPAAVILMSLSEPITGAIYGRGNFGPDQVAAAAPTLAAFAFGLPAYMATKVFTTTFFAHKDTKTPLTGSIISIVTNIVFIILLMPVMQHTGIALATSISSWFNCFYLICVLGRLGTVKIDRKTKIECLKQFAVAFVMLFFVLFSIKYAACYFSLGGFQRGIALLSVILSGVFVFFVIGKIFNMFAFLDAMKRIDVEPDAATAKVAPKADPKADK